MNGHPAQAAITLRVDGQARSLTVDTRTTLLDALRERLGHISPKKGCDHGQCGACTILLDGERALSCLALAAAYDGAEATTADGTDAGGVLDRVRQAFIDTDAFQCGYCTLGQVCSAAGVLREVRRGWPSHVTADLTTDPELSGAEVAERMALHEISVMDPRLGQVVNHDLAEYHVATNADVTSVEAHWLDEHDPYVNAMGSKGIGEIGIVGTAAAVANAVYHATGVRVRHLPVTLDKLLGGLP